MSNTFAYVNVALAIVVMFVLGKVEFAQASGIPTVEFTHIPPYGSTDNLTGRVTNVNGPAYGVAVYVFVGGWWTKPTFEAPLCKVSTNGMWSCDITTGGSDAYATQLAAYLVPTNYAPPLASGWAQLPAALESNAVATVRATRPYTRRIWFSGYEWSVKDSRGLRTDPGNNYFSDSASNAWADAQGRLHLKICKRAGLWSCAEVVSVRSFGYGTYRMFMGSSGDSQDARAVLGFFTWNDDAPYAHREIDVEISRWDNTSDTNNAQFVVQPWDSAGHLTRYRVPPIATNATHSFTWLSNRIDFVSHASPFILPPASNTAASQWSYTTDGVPQTGNENVRLNLWLFNSAGTTDGQDEEVVINRFAFIPSPMPQPVWTNTAWAPGFSSTAAVEPQLTYQVEASTNLAEWRVVATIEATNSTLAFSDTQTPAPRQQFYRLRAPEQ